MPASLTHYTFVKENVDNYNRYFSLTSLGGQGPDVFFFYGYSFKKRKNIPQVQQFGTLLHHINVSSAYYFLLKFANNNSNKDLLYAYIKGLLLHYILDRNVHPYVFYRTGFSSNKAEQKDFSLSHIAFETILDVYYSHLHHTFNKPSKYIKSKRKYVHIVSTMFYELAKYLNYDYINDNTYYLAYKDMRISQKMLFSRHGFKKHYYNKHMYKSVVNAMSMPMNVHKYDKYDILNNTHLAWADCLTNKARTESVDDLVKKASLEIAKLDELLYKAKNNCLSFEEFDGFINNIDHDGFPVGAVKKYYKLLWE